MAKSKSTKMKGKKGKKNCWFY